MFGLCGGQSERDWIDVLTALLTPLVAIIAVGIAFAQWRTARHRLKLDLFEKRSAVYAAAHDFVFAVCAQSKATREEVQAFLRGTRGARWLFSREMEKLFEEMFWKAKRLDRLGEKMRSAPEAELDAINNEHLAICEWFDKQSRELDDMFAQYLQLKH